MWYFLHLKSSTNATPVKGFRGIKNQCAHWIFIPRSLDGGFAFVPVMLTSKATRRFAVATYQIMGGGGHTEGFGKTEAPQAKAYGAPGKSA